MGWQGGDDGGGAIVITVSLLHDPLILVYQDRLMSEAYRRVPL